jgi:hypothetical protein
MMVTPAGSLALKGASLQLTRYNCLNHQRDYHPHYHQNKRCRPARLTRRYTIPVFAEVGCADSNVLLETATLRHPVEAVIGTTTEECEYMPWKSSHKRSKFYFCLIIPVIPHRLKWLSPSKVLWIYRNAVVRASKAHTIVPTVGLNKQFCTLYSVLSTRFNSVSQTGILYFSLFLNPPLLSIFRRQPLVEWENFCERWKIWKWPLPIKLL